MMSFAGYAVVALDACETLTGVVILLSGPRMLPRANRPADEGAVERGDYVAAVGQPSACFGQLRIMHSEVG